VHRIIVELTILLNLALEILKCWYCTQGQWWVIKVVTKITNSPEISFAISHWVHPPLRSVVCLPAPIYHTPTPGFRLLLLSILLLGRGPPTQSHRRKCANILCSWLQ